MRHAHSICEREIRFSENSILIMVNQHKTREICNRREDPESILPLKGRLVATVVGETGSQHGSFVPKTIGYKRLVMAYPDNVHPITDQPKSGTMGGWGGKGGVPRGLEVLADVEYIRIKQKVEWCEVCCSCETENEYEIQSAAGHKLFSAKEDSGCCTRQCCSARRPFDMKIKSPDGREVMRFDRPWRCQSCLCPCCLQKVRVYAPPGDENLIGTVEQQWTCRVPEFSILNEVGDKIMDVEGPCCTCSCGCLPCCCGSSGFEISQDGTPVGRLVKEWSKLGKEVMTDADTFYVTFPRTMDVKAKATLLACVILIDFMYFETTNTDKVPDAPTMIDG